MTRHPQAWIATALCSAALLAVPALAREPVNRPAGQVASSPLPRTLPLKREEPAASGGSSWLAAAILLAVLLMAAGALLLRRRGVAGWAQRWQAAGSAGAPIARLSSRALTPQASVHAIRWAGEELLLACTPQQVTVLARRPLPPPAGAGQ